MNFDAQQFMDDVKGWASSPFTGPLPLWAIAAIGGVFILLLWLVIDRQDVIKQAQSLVEAA